jgi:polyvinyl alcohol dehydrogenase (cytochrome)
VLADQNGGNLIAVNTANGDPRWVAYIGGGNYFGIVTQSPVVHDGVVYVGVASAEEGVVAFVPLPCCHDRGSFSAVDATTGAVPWQTYMTVDDPPYSGAGVWGSIAALDPSTRPSTSRRATTTRSRMTSSSASRMAAPRRSASTRRTTSTRSSP